MLMAIFELTEMETKDEGPSLRIDRFAAEVESKVPKAERRADAHASGKGHMVRVGSASDSIDLWQKAAGMCRRSKQGFYVQTSVNRNSY